VRRSGSHRCGTPRAWRGPRPIANTSRRRGRRARVARRVSPRALALTVHQAVLARPREPRLPDLAPTQVYATLLDEGRYPCAPRTMYPLLAGASEIRERRTQLPHPAYARPALLATAPNQLRCRRHDTRAHRSEGLANHEERPRRVGPDARKVDLLDPATGEGRGRSRRDPGERGPLSGLSSQGPPPLDPGQ
jgi:hypothetical protein